MKRQWLNSNSPMEFWRILRLVWGECKFYEYPMQKGEIKLASYSAYSGVKGSSPLGEINNPYGVPWQQAKQNGRRCTCLYAEKTNTRTRKKGLRDIRIVEAIYKSART